METATTTNPLNTTTISSPFDNMDSTHASPDFLKLEDLDHHDSADFAATTHSTPPPVVVQSKPAKKRKSWGQQLPEPKTTLPPRKRAKTDDEKEQRRIERIKRNRAAAHNSRERKRQEAEVLAVENAQLRTKLEAFEKHFGPLPKHIVLPEVTLCTDDAATPAPSLIESRGSIAPATSPASPPDLYDLTNDDVTIKQEPHDSPYSDYHHAFDTLDDVVRPAVSVEQLAEGGATAAPYSLDHPYPGGHPEHALPTHLPDHRAGDLDAFTSSLFTPGANGDFSFTSGLDFSFDDLLHTDGLSSSDALAIPLGDGAGAA